MRKIAILGGGNGGLTAAAHLSLNGHQVSLFEMPALKDNIVAVKERMGLDITGSGVEGQARLHVVTWDIAEALEDVDIIFNPVPAFAYEAFAQASAPYLKDGQVVVTMGKGGGAFHWASALRRVGVNKDVALGEINTLPHACRRLGPTLVRVNGFNKVLICAAFPAKNTERVVAALQEIYPEVGFRKAPNILETILVDYNTMSHVPPMVCNAARIESGYGKEEFAMFGKVESTPSVVRLMEIVDSERMAISEALGIKARSFAEEMFMVGFNPAGKEGAVLSLYDAMHTEKLEVAKGPYSLLARHITEDVPFGLVTYVSLAEMLGVPAPMSHALVVVCSGLNGTDYYEQGRTVDKLGIDKSWTVEQVNKFLYEGFQD